MLSECTIVHPSPKEVRSSKLYYLVGVWFGSCRHCSCGVGSFPGLSVAVWWSPQHPGTPKRSLLAREVLMTTQVARPREAQEIRLQSLTLGSNHKPRRLPFCKGCCFYKHQFCFRWSSCGAFLVEWGNAPARACQRSAIWTLGTTWNCGIVKGPIYV